MSDITPDPVIDEPVVDPTPSATIEIEVDDDTTATPPPPAQAEADRLNLDEYGAKLIPIKVNGEEKWVPLSEAQQGYMRQQDYTQKTQATAADRESLAEARAIADALRKDPEGTIEILRDWYTEEDETPDTPEVETDPVLRELKEWKDAQETKAQNDALEAELARMESETGVPGEELLRFAVEQNIPNLEWAYAMMQTAKGGAAQTLQQRTEQAEAARVAAKQGLATHGGVDRSSDGSAAPQGNSDNVSTIADAWRLAGRQLTRG